MTDLAALGGAPAFPHGLAFVRPPLPDLERVVARLAPSYDRGVVTNGPLVAELEARVAERLGTRHAVAVASGTAGLMLALRAVDAEGGVLLPGFTFSASAHAVAWNGRRPVFAECDAATFQLDCDDAGRRLEGVGAVLATHVFGAPCAPRHVERLAEDGGTRLVFDAAAAFGATAGGRAVGGFGDAEVFSLTPTKPLMAAEGGLVTTDDDAVADAVRLGREYGNPGDYDSRFVGLNGRMSEPHAAIALASLADLDEHLARRRRIASRYEAALAGVPGVRFQQVDGDDRPTWKDCTIVVEAERFGMDRTALASVLHADGVETRTYFHPPVHRQHAYRHEPRVELPVTEALAGDVLSLPIYPGLDDADVDRVAGVVTAAHEQSARLRAAHPEVGASVRP